MELPIYLPIGTNTRIVGEQIGEKMDLFGFIEMLKIQLLVLVLLVKRNGVQCIPYD
jgi:hypothetical protein